MAETIRITGLKEFRAKLRSLDRKAPRQLRVAGNEAAEIVVFATKPDVPTLTGRAKSSVRAASTQSAARVRAGSKRVPYYGWLEFGGRVGKNNSVHRDRVKAGRYMFPAYAQNRENVRDRLADAIERAARDAGLNPH